MLFMLPFEAHSLRNHSLTGHVHTSINSQTAAFGSRYPGEYPPTQKIALTL